MKITDIRAAVLEGFGGDWILIQVYTDEGLVGLGETFPTLPLQGYALKEMVLWMKPLLVGEDPTNVDKLFLKMYNAHVYRGASIAGALTMAISGIELALWDLAGKAAGLPVYRLLGGKHRDEIRVYADFHGGESEEPASFAERAQEVVEEGFGAIKLDIDLRRWRAFHDPYRAASAAEIRHLTAVVGAVREAVGEDVDLLVDCHSGFDTLSAVKLARAMEPFNLFWLEEPVPPGNVAAMKAVTESTRTPICTGENLYTRFEFRDLLEQQAVHIIEPDVQKTGGILESKRIADLASTYYVLMAPHCVTSPVGTMASVHLCASIANFLILEYHQIDVPWWNDIAITDEPLVQNGRIRVPDAPGLGVQLNPAEVARHLRPGETLFEN